MPRVLWCAVALAGAALASACSGGGSTGSSAIGSGGAVEPHHAVNGVVDLTAAFAKAPVSDDGPPTLQYVSCGGNFCMLIAGDYAVPWENGVAGKAQPMLTDAQGQPITETPSVGCSSDKFCVYATGEDRYALWNGSTWKTGQDAPDTTQGLAALGAGQVACPSDGTCFAILNDGTDGNPVIGSWTGSGWAPHPLGNGGDILAKITCAQANYCLALGNESSVWTWDGQSWTGPRSLPDPAVPGAGYTIDAVDCVAGPFCIGGSELSGTVLEDHGAGFQAVTSLPDLYRPGNDGSVCVSAAYCLVKRVSDAASAPVQVLRNGTTLGPGPSGADELFTNENVVCLPNRTCFGWNSGKDTLDVHVLPTS